MITTYLEACCGLFLKKETASATIKVTSNATTTATIKTTMIPPDSSSFTPHSIASLPSTCNWIGNVAVGLDGHGTVEHVVLVRSGAGHVQKKNGT